MHTTNVIFALSFFVLSRCNRKTSDDVTEDVIVVTLKEHYTASLPNGKMRLEKINKSFKGKPCTRPELSLCFAAREFRNYKITYKPARAGNRTPSRYI